MAKPPSSAGVKRPATEAVASVGTEEKAEFSAFGRREPQRVRLADGSGAREQNPDDTSLSHENSACAAVVGAGGEPRHLIGNIGNLDILFHIACCLDTGPTLRKFCISVGPRDAAVIRTRYLRKNDRYLVKLLRRLNPIKSLTNDFYYRLGAFKRNLGVFDRCRDGIIAWMEVNKDWKDRCTTGKIEAAKKEGRQSSLINADVFFNNPMVAIEIGLLEVFRYLVETMHININGKFWPGFVSGGLKDQKYSNGILAQAALVRGDVDLLQYLLSVDELDLTKQINMNWDTRTQTIDDDLIRTIVCGSKACVSNESFQCLIKHPNVDLNYNRMGIECPLLEVARNYISYVEIEPNTTSSKNRRVALSRLRMMIEEGADPHLPVLDEMLFLGQSSCIEYIKKVTTIKSLTEKTRYR